MATNGTAKPSVVSNIVLAANPTNEDPTYEPPARVRIIDDGSVIVEQIRPAVDTQVLIFDSKGQWTVKCELLPSCGQSGCDALALHRYQVA